MTDQAPQLLAHGLVFSQDVLYSQWFAVLAAFVAINTVMYVALAIAKALPRLHLQDYLPRRYERAQTRSIHPDAPK